MYIGDKIRMKYVENNIPFASGSGQTCLDVGCGDMLYKKAIEIKNYKWRGIDKEKCNEEVEEFDLDTAQVFSYVENFELIICIDVLEHLKNPFIVLDKLCLMLKQNGRLIVHVPNRNQTHIMIEPEKNAGHIVEGFNPWDIKDSFEKKLRNVKIEYTFNWNESIAWDLDYIFRNNIDINIPLRRLLYFDIAEFIPYGILAIGDK